MDYIVEAEVQCPYCGESFTTTADTSQGSYSTIEDCTVCCRPIALRIECDAGELIAICIDRA